MKCFNPRARGAVQALGLGCLLAFLMFLPTMIAHDGVFLITGDYVQQQVGFMLEGKRLLSEGQPFWSFNTGMGVNFLGNYAFYLTGSPFFWLTMLFPASAIPYVMGPVLMLKCGIAAMGAFLYLEKFLNKRLSLMGAVMYAFSGFQIISMVFNHFADVVAAFPFLLLATEMQIRAAEKNKHHPLAPFALAVAVNALINFYFFAGQVIFLAIYWFCRVVINPEFSSKRRRLTLRLITGGICGLLLSGIVFLPFFFAMSQNGRAQSSLTWQTAFFYDFQRYLEIFRTQLMPIESAMRNGVFYNTSRWTSTAAFMPLFGIGLCWLYMWEKRDWLSKLLWFLLLCSCVPFLNSIFSLFSSRTLNRWWYMMVLMQTLATLLIYSEVQARPVKQRAAMLWLPAALLLLITLPFVILNTVLYGALDKFNALMQTVGALLPLGSAMEQIYQSELYSREVYIFAGYAMFAVNIALLACVLFLKRWRKRALMLVCVCAVINGSVYFFLNNTDETRLAGVNTRIIGLDYYHDIAIRPGAVKPDDDALNYRIDYPWEIRNYSLYVGLPAVSSFHSVRNPYADEFAHALALGSPNDVFITLTNEHPQLRQLMSIKYYIDFNNDVQHETPLPGFINILQNEKADIYENEYFIPMGFTYDYYADEADARRLVSQLDNLMLEAVLLDAPAQDAVRGCMQKLDITSDMESQLNWRASSRARAASACTDFTRDGGGFAATADLEKENLIFFSVPFDAGWKAFINGEQADIINANIGFMAVIAPEGRSRIVFEYTTPGLSAGMVMSSIGIIMLAAIIACDAAVRRKRKAAGG